MLRSMSRLYRVPRLTGQMVRFLKFNSVGLIGFALQLGVLAVLLRLGVHYLAATALAVELAVLHNFAWHERWTWRDRAAGPDGPSTGLGAGPSTLLGAGPSTLLGAGRRTRLWRFHASNGLISLAGNLVLMRLMVGLLGLPAVPANLLSVLLCSLVNFTASDRFVFRVT
jgi:putative flippase GtrA